MSITQPSKVTLSQPMATTLRILELAVASRLPQRMVLPKVHTGAIYHLRATMDREGPATCPTAHTVARTIQVPAGEAITLASKTKQSGEAFIVLALVLVVQTTLARTASLTPQAGLSTILSRPEPREQASPPVTCMIRRTTNMAMASRRLEMTTPGVV